MKRRSFLALPAVLAVPVAAFAGISAASQAKEVSAEGLLTIKTKNMEMELSKFAQVYLNGQKYWMPLFK